MRDLQSAIMITTIASVFEGGYARSKPYEKVGYPGSRKKNNKKSSKRKMSNKSKARNRK